MLTYLRIRDLALLADVTLELGPGLAVLTGETGAGKSIVVDALTLLRGGRARTELVRGGADACVVEAQFELTGALAARVGRLLAAPESDEPPSRALATEDEETGTRGAAAPSAPSLGSDAIPDRALVLQRVVPRSGRGRVLVDRELMTQSALSALGECLIDVCSQHEHQSLNRPGRQLELVDDFAGNGALLAGFEAAYGAYVQAVRDRDALARASPDAAGRADYLRFQLAELTAAAPSPGEMSELRARIAVLRDARSWMELTGLVRELLYDADDSVCGRLALVQSRLRDVARVPLRPAGELMPTASPERTGAEADELEGDGSGFAARLRSLASELETARVACAEAAQLAVRIAGDIATEPGELALAEERLHQLVALERKHGSLDAVPVLVARLQRELDELERRDERLAAAERRVTATRDGALACAAELSVARRAAAGPLGEAITAELAELHLGTARVQIAVTTAPHDELGPRGLDRVEIQLAANPGEPLAPLARVASGGELSRVLLAIKNVVATRRLEPKDASAGKPSRRAAAADAAAEPRPQRRAAGRAGVSAGAGQRLGSGVSTYVFDEVDAGVGGAVAVAIGLRLRRAAAGSQILCITHLPQLAAFADAHYRVEKRTVGGRTTAHVTRLDAEARVEELARMLGGRVVTESARSHARQLLADAARAWTQGPPAPVLESSAPDTSAPAPPRETSRARRRRRDDAPRSSAPKDGEKALATRGLPGRRSGTRSAA